MFVATALLRRPLVHTAPVRGQAVRALGRYLQSLLRGTRLDALLGKHAEMLLEIKNLDSDMQMLVYENYNRFISATDTLRTMKSNVDGMDASMQQLHTVTGGACHQCPWSFQSNLVGVGAVE